MKKILFAASEAVPFCKTGGLADVVGSLPKYFDKKKYDVRIMIPKYMCIDEKWKQNMTFKTHFYVQLGWRSQYVGIWEAEYDSIHYYLLDNEFYFAGCKPYGEVYQDIEKFAFFSKAVLASLPVIGFQPDIIHCHDWQTALIPVYLKSLYEEHRYYQSIGTIFTIHNIRFQGRWEIPKVQDATGLPEYFFTEQGLECYGDANYMKGGIIFADAVTTVSPTYALEIMTAEGGEGLDGVLRKYHYKVSGILNGLDDTEFHPDKDHYIKKQFTPKTVIAGKKANKKALQQMFKLPEREDVFLVGMVSRMSEQKGFDLVNYILEELLSKEDIQMVVLGTGEERYQNSLKYFASRFPKKISVHIGYAEDMAHQIYASCDAFLMPSLFEPCGLSQLMSMSYGTLPIVRETGGLRDTVEAYNKYEQTGTGFSFAKYDALEMKGVLLMAKELYETDKKAWKAMMLRAMKADFSWNASVKEYQKLYESLKRRGY